MKVLHVFSDPRMGGPGTRTLDIARSLRDEDVESIFVIPEGRDSLASAAEGQDHAVERIRLPRLRDPRRVKDNIQFFTKFYKTVSDYSSLIYRAGADIVHVNTPYNFQPAIAASRTNAKLVWHFNDTLTPWPVSTIAATIADHLADTIIADSRRVIDYFSLHEEATQIIYPCVDVGEFFIESNSLQMTFGPNSRRPVIGCVGNLNPVKGQDYLLEALPDILHEFGPVTVQFAGTRLDSQEQYYQCLQRKVDELGLHDHVEFLGWRSDVAELLSSFDLFVVPSLSESGPIVLLEAMAMGVPTVTTNVGIVGEKVKDGEHAWVVPPKAPQELATSIIDALQMTNERKERAMDARTLIEEEFSLDTISKQYLELYRSIVSKTP